MKIITRKSLGKRKKKCDSAFTFIETLAVLAVTAILTSQIGLAAYKLLEKARISAAQTQIQELKVALQAYYADSGIFPSEEQGLMALWEEPELYPLAKNWNGPYTDKKIHADPWGNPFAYFTRGNAIAENILPRGLPFGILSYGADGKEGGQGNDKDIFSWE